MRGRRGGMALPVTAAGGGIGDILGQLPGAAQQPQPGEGGPTTEESEFVNFLAEDVQQVWAAKFAEDGRDYTYARLNMFSGQVATACGNATAAVGPFYCPGDSEVYIDLDFFRELQTRFDAPGDFAQAYVIAHEFGHHVQNLLGTNEEVRRRQAAGSEEEANQWSVKLELQADCYAGVWAQSVQERGEQE